MNKVILSYLRFCIISILFSFLFFQVLGQSQNPGIIDHLDIGMPRPSANTQFDPFIIVNRQNPNIIAATSSTIINGNSNQGKYISNDAGISWSGTDDLDPNYSLLFFDGNGDNGNGNVAIDASGRIYMTTVGPDGRQVFITKSTNNGTSFSPLTPILSPH